MEIKGVQVTNLNIRLTKSGQLIGIDFVLGKGTFIEE